MSKTNKLALIPVMLCFFAMGFVDLVGIASNYVKEDLALSDSVANILPSLVFFWFLIFSVPTGVLMNKIGRKKTVLLSLVVTNLSLLLPIFSENFYVMLISFSLLGIGNALMQTSLNPLVSTVIKGNLAATLTFGQFVKAIASLMAPYIAMWGALATIPAFGLGWRVLFPIYMIVGVIASLLLASTPIEEETDTLDADENDTVASHFSKAFGLLGTPAVLLSFVAIICHVGIDVGANTTAPKILMERLGMTLNEAAFATSLYFIFRTIGCLTGSFFFTGYEESHILYHQRRDDDFVYARTACRNIQTNTLYSHRLSGIWQLQHLLHRVLAGTSFGARKEKCREWSDDYGAVRWYGVPVAHGICQRCHRSDWRSRRHGCRCGLSVYLYNSSETLKTKIWNVIL